MYVFDYGAPTGFRLAATHPERVAAVISQNGNAYEEGLSDGWNPIRAYWIAPFLAVWGKNDPFFLPAGALAFKRVIPDADVRFFDTGHLALETHCDEIAAAIRDFLDGVDWSPLSRRRSEQ
jgi:pimeloyl-ACP methyl ester carboxylesterase